MRVGDFDIGLELGRGGMGVVYNARQVSSGRDAVVKTLLPSATDAVLTARALREGELLSSLEHPALVSVYASGVEAGRPWLAMERLDGEDLSRESIPVDDVAALCRELAPAASALALCHLAGIVHRDIKPANLFRDKSSGLIKLVDFGLARSDTGEGETLTMSGQITGTPEYMSPEQLGHRSEVGPPSDVWSFGLSIHVLVSGDHPFRRGSQVATMKALMTERPRPLDKLRPGLPEGLSALVGRCLMVDPEARPSASELSEELQRIGASAATAEAGGRSSGRARFVGLGLVALALLLGLGKLGLMLTEPARRIRPAEETLIVKDREVVLKGEVERAGGRIEVRLAGPGDAAAEVIRASPDSRGRYAIPLELTAEGEWRATLTLFGHFDREESSARISIRLDQAPPELTIERLVDGRVVIRDTVEGRVGEPLRSLTANGRSVFVDRGGRFELRDLAAEGGAPVRLVATDLAGNETRLELTVVPESGLVKVADEWLLDPARWATLRGRARDRLTQHVLAESPAWLRDIERWSKLPASVRAALTRAVGEYLGEAFEPQPEVRRSLAGVERPLGVLRLKGLEIPLLIIPQDLDPEESRLGGCLVMERRVTRRDWERVREGLAEVRKRLKNLSAPELQRVDPGPEAVNANQGSSIDFPLAVQRALGYIMSPFDFRFPSESEWAALFGAGGLLPRERPLEMPEWTSTLVSEGRTFRGIKSEDLKTLPRVLRGGKDGSLRIVTGPGRRGYGALRLFIRLPGSGKLDPRPVRAERFRKALGTIFRKRKASPPKPKLKPGALKRLPKTGPGAGSGSDSGTKDKTKDK